MVVLMGGLWERTTLCATCALLESSLQYTYARSRTSGLSFSAVAAWKIRCTSPCAWVLSVFLRKSLTTAVKICNCVWSIISIRFKGLYDDANLCELF